MKNCNKCKREIPDGKFKECPNCGLKFCDSCANNTKNICPRCYYNLEYKG